MEAVFRRVLNGKFSEIPGLTVDATIPIPEKLVNELLDIAIRVNENVESCHISIYEQNRVTVNIKAAAWPWPFNLKLKLFRAVDLSGPPKVRAFLENNVMLGRLGALFRILPGGVTLYEDQISVDLGAFVTDPDQKNLLQLLDLAEIKTEPGKVILDLKLKVDET